MAGVVKWLKKQKSKQRVLVLLSGGNIAPETYQKIWQESFLEKLPI